LAPKSPRLLATSSSWLPCKILAVFGLGDEAFDTKLNLKSGEDMNDFLGVAIGPLVFDGVVCPITPMLPLAFGGAVFAPRA
jgi:hypothetical protein